MKPAWPHCPWCERRHAETHACQPVRELLAAMRARGDSLTLPALAFPDEPVVMPGLDQPGDTLLSQIVVNAAVVEVGSMPRAALLFTGRDSAGKPMPRWLMVDTDERIAGVGTLVVEMAATAVTGAQSRRP